MEYSQFLDNKSQKGGKHGFEPVFMPDFLYDFQKNIVTWAIEKGRAAIFADCGLGKTPMQLVWAQNIIEHSNKPVLIVTPLAVSAQTAREADKFSIPYERSKDGKTTGKPNIVITNYERLIHFNPENFASVVCDESSAIKNMDGKRKQIVTEFMRTIPYRLLCTATASPNDYVELGTSSEALGELGNMDMLQMFFKSEDNTMHPGTLRYNPIWYGAKWRFKAHAEKKFWQWVVSWARAIRRPSDIGYNDDKFKLPPLVENEHVVVSDVKRNGMLLSLPATSLQEQQEERRLTTTKRCELVAELLDNEEPAVSWCHYNKEADLLEKLIPDAKQVSGSQSDEEKEEIFLAFADGEIKKIVTKPRIGGFGLNWQHCNRMTFFPSHSFEQYYQGTRRCWRFGQKRTVTIDIVTSEGEMGVMRNLQRKVEAANKMFTMLVAEMNNEISLKRDDEFRNKVDVPKWL